MAIETETRLAGPYTGDGSQTVFSFAFKVFQSSDVQVWTSSDGINESVLPSTSYSVTLNSSQETNPGGSVTLNSALASGYKLSITSAVAYLQPMVLTNQGGFYPEVLNTTADRQTILAQQLKTKIDRAIRVPLTSSESSESLLAQIITAKETAITKASEAAASATSAATSATEATTAVEGFDDHVDDKKDEIDAYVVTKKSAIDTYVLAKETAFDGHVTDKTTTFDANATSKTTAFDSNATSKTTAFDSHVTTKTSAFDAHAAEKQAAVDASAQAASDSATAAASSATDASGYADDASESATEAAASATEAATAVSGFDSHVEDKKTEFNTNATTKTNTFNSNATAKTSTFDSNATAKTSTFDSNATTKTAAFDSNATSKTTDFNTNFTEKKAVIDAGVVEAQGYVADAKKWAIGDPSEPAGSHSAKWFAEHMALNFKGEYSATTTYDVNQFVSSTETSTTKFYISIVNGNIGNPLSDTTKWSLLFTITSGGTVAWGSITGSIASQSDLSSALAGKEPTISDLATIRSGAALGATAQQPETTLAGYGITDASISNGVITLGAETITPLTSSSTLDASKLSGTASIDTTGNAATATTATSATTATDYAESGGIATALSGKQATISDLADIRTGAGLGATAVQPSAITDMATKTWVGSQNFLTSTSTLDATKLSGTASISTTGNAATATTATDYAAGGGIATALSGKQATISDLSDIRTGAALGATAQQPATTLSGYGITDASISNGVITLGSNTITPLTSHQDITGKVNVSGSRGSLAGYCTSGSAASIDASSSDCNEVSANVVLSDGASGTSWTKIVRLTAAVTVTLGSGWSWVGGSAPTIAAGGILVCCWCGSGGMVNYASPS